MTVSSQPSSSLQHVSNSENSLDLVCDDSLVDGAPIGNIASVLVAIASYGRAQDHFLKKVVAEFRKLSVPTRIVVLSDKLKPVEEAEVVAGLPSRNPYSLPFAHRKLFAENVENYDLFIYTEDDTLLTPQHLKAFLEMQASLEDNEIIGFIRSETTPEGKTFVTSINNHFRWRPETLTQRGGHLFVQLSNQHSGCFIATRSQLLRAIRSGGFVVAPHDEKYGMLESAASDLYTQCGLRRLICISDIDRFIVPHLPNKYYPRLGIPVEELQGQVAAMCRLFGQDYWKGSLFEPESRVPGFRWSKDLYERSDDVLMGAIPSSARSLLSVGCAFGEMEACLVEKGVAVSAVPLDAIFGASLRRRGIAVVDGPMGKAMRALQDERFDTVVLAGCLHLLEKPEAWLRELHKVLRSEGILIASVDNTCEFGTWLRDHRSGRKTSLFPTYRESGVHAVTPKALRRWFKAAGFTRLNIRPIFRQSWSSVSGSSLKPLGPIFAERFIIDAYEGYKK